jgi:hypothetical protein
MPVKTRQRRASPLPFLLLVPTRCVGTPVKTRRRRNSPLPFRINFQYPGFAGINTGAGIAPMHRIVDIAAFDGILVDVFYFLSHHRIALHLFGMRAFFPDLIVAVVFMHFFIESQLFQDALGSLLFQRVEQAFCGP